MVQEREMKKISPRFLGFVLALLGAGVVTLAGCGVKGDPIPYVEAYKEPAPEAAPVPVAPPPAISTPTPPPVNPASKRLKGKKSK